MLRKGIGAGPGTGGGLLPPWAEQGADNGHGAVNPFYGMPY